ncbi:MAG: hypothetical protein A2007_03430 [Verrucomicrobia bacterium GWC2_42_7]|nr:MAG: hypothetical protein A2007_03430 [Verrucomicrobia bacterium GWC2_42_7]
MSSKVHYFLYFLRCGNLFFTRKETWKPFRAFQKKEYGFGENSDILSLFLSHVTMESHKIIMQDFYNKQVKKINSLGMHYAKSKLTKAIL